MAEGIPTCVFDGSPAVARFILDAGCVARPGDRMQNLCAQHADRATPLGDMVLVEDYTVDDAFTRWWRGDESA